MSRRTRFFRDLHGIVLLDKPLGLSSNQALQAVRRLFRAAKGGHTGALDPLATGLLPLCFGEGTKIAGQLLGSRKAYLAECRLGITTDDRRPRGRGGARTPGAGARRRDDRGGAGAVARAHQCRCRRCIRRSSRAASALYVKARRGEAVEVPAREVDVHRLELLARDGRSPAACWSSAARAPTSAAWRWIWARRSVAARTSPRCAGSGWSRSCEPAMVDAGADSQAAAEQGDDALLSHAAAGGRRSGRICRRCIWMRRRAMAISRRAADRAAGACAASGRCAAFADDGALLALRRDGRAGGVRACCAASTCRRRLSRRRCAELAADLRSCCRMAPVVTIRSLI